MKQHQVQVANRPYTASDSDDATSVYPDTSPAAAVALRRWANCNAYNKVEKEQGSSILSK